MVAWGRSMRRPTRHPRATSSSTPEQVGDRFDPRQVVLTDQFNTERVNVLRPEAFCAPVDKEGSGINNATADLACYKIRDVRGNECPKFGKRRVEAEISSAHTVCS
jgi:hypothetical protein